MIRSVPLILLLAGTAAAQGDAAHGGQVHRTDTHVYEVVLEQNQVRVYVTELQGEPVSLRSLGGRIDVAAVRVQEQGARVRRNHVGTTLRLSYQGKNARDGRLRDCLVASHELVDGSQEREVLRARMRMEVKLEDRAGHPVSFEVSFASLSPEVSYRCQGAECARVYRDPGVCDACEGNLVRDGADDDQGGEGESRSERRERARDERRERRDWRRIR